MLSPTAGYLVKSSDVEAALVERRARVVRGENVRLPPPDWFAPLPPLPRIPAALAPDPAPPVLSAPAAQTLEDAPSIESGPGVPTPAVDEAEFPFDLVAEDRGDGTLRVWCAWCKTHHSHGDAGGGGRGYGHRGAHCADPESPYHRRGYRLVAAPADVPTLPPLTPEQRTAHDELVTTGSSITSWSPPWSATVRARRRC